MLSNAFKHGFPEGRSGTIRITLTDLGDGVRELVIADDGIGLPDGFDVAKGKGLGMQIIRSLAGQLGGTATFENARRHLPDEVQPSSETPASP